MLISDGVNVVQDLQAFVGEFAVAVLDLMLCVDPNAIETLRTLSPKSYANDLKTWPPLVNAIAAVSRDPAISAAVADLETAVIDSQVAGLSFVTTQVATVAITTMINSLSSGSSSSAAATSATAAAQQATVSAVTQMLIRTASNPELKAYADTIPGLIVPAIQNQIANLTRPEVVATLPVIGPTIVCLGRKLSSPAVSDVIRRGQDYIKKQTIPKISLISSSVVDPCRESLDIYDCADNWKNVYPSILEQRQDIYQLSKTPGDSLDVLYYSMNQSALPYSSSTIPDYCQLYESLGCSAVATMTLQSRSVAGWGQYVNATRDLIDSYLTPLNDTISYVTYYADTRVLPCFLTGHIAAFVSSIAITCNVLVQFNRRIIEMRQGKNPYRGVFEKTDPATFSSTSTPTLGGMVVATAFAQYYVSPTSYYIIFCDGPVD